MNKTPLSPFLVPFKSYRETYHQDMEYGCANTQDGQNFPILGNFKAGSVSEMFERLLQSCMDG